MDIVIRFIADGSMFVIAGLALVAMIAWTPASERYYRYTRIVMAGVTSYVLAKIAGLLYQPESMRPFEKMGVDPGAAFLNNPGFPSDHALFAMFLALAAWYACRRRWVAVVLLCSVAVVSIGRVVALVHTVTDVIGGIAVAVIGSILWYGLFRKKVV